MRHLVKFLIFLILISISHATWFNDSWAYCREITLNSGFDSNFTHDIVLNSTNFDFSLAKTDLSDLRFLEGSCDTPNTGIGNLTSWNQSLDTNLAVIKVKTDTANISKIAMYYGNPSAPIIWNVTTVGIFGDDFTYFTGVNTTNWRVYHNITVSGGIVTIPNTSIGNCYFSQVCNSIISNVNFTNKTTFEFAAKFPNSSSGRIGLSNTGASSMYEIVTTIITANELAMQVVGATSNTHSVPKHGNDWVLSRMEWSPNYYAYYENNSFIYSNSSSIPNTPLPFYFIERATSSGYMQIDWVVVKQINTTALSYNFSSTFFFNNSIINNLLNNSDYYLNSSPITFNFSLVNINDSTAYYFILDNETIKQGSSTSPNNITFTYMVNDTGYHYYTIETNDSTRVNTTYLQVFTVHNALISYTPNNELLNSPTVSFKWESWASDNVTYTVMLNGNIIDTGTTDDIQNNTLLYTVAGDTVYYWNVSLYNSELGETIYSTTKTFSIFSVSGVFEDYLGVDLSLCPGNVTEQVQICNEKHKITTNVNFSAIVCPSLNTSYDYTCITNQSAGKYTKNNYTIFYAPNNTWAYGDGLTGIEHVGAIWYYAGVALDARFELLPSGHFIFIPAQNRTFDCGVKYQYNCSYYGGFTINNKQVFVSDIDGVFYTTSGIGLTDYNESNYGSVQLNTPLYPLEAYSIPIFNQGIFTLTNCQNLNNTFSMNLINTRQQDYVVTTTGTNGTTYLYTGKSLVYSVPLYADTTVVVTANDDIICRYDFNQPIFISSSMSFVNQDFLIYFLYLMELFTLVMSIFVPLFFLFFFIINDAFQVFDVGQVAIIFAFSIMASFVVNLTSFERGLKHVMILVAIFTGYLLVLSPFQSISGADFAPLTSISDSFATLMDSKSLPSLALNSAGFLFTFLFEIATLPAKLVDFMFALLYTISPILHGGLSKFKILITFGLISYVYLKAYEIITKQFRGV